ncbi:MAG: DNA-binding response regulator [Eubacterium sp.]|jgi:DNA-binding response OmpR family regulator|nr:DNA-binding response regulator [Eubacterium sp.]
MVQETILVVDDEKEIRNLIEVYLKNEGYKVLKVSNGVEALEIMQSNRIHLIILDIMMPKMDGLEACMKIREKNNVPIIMLSARNHDMDKILGLSSGADDYVAKPFNPMELVARVKSQLRRYLRLKNMDAHEEGQIEIDELVINVTTHKVKVRNNEVRLTPREFAVLELLARNPGVVFSMERIYEAVWNEDFFDAENTVMVHIRKIREKIEEDSRKPKYIKTVWGVGYKLEKPV